jgi:hypothetical protein
LPAEQRREERDFTADESTAWKAASGWTQISTEITEGSLDRIYRINGIEERGEDRTPSSPRFGFYSHRGEKR